MSRLLVLEGDGDAAFFRELLKVRGIAGFEILERNQLEGQDGEADLTTGITAFGTVLESILVRRDVDDIELVVLVADCDSDPANSFRQVAKQVKKVGAYAIPKEPRTVAVAKDKKSVSVLMLPWDDVPGCLVLIQRKLECWRVGVSELGRASCRGSRGILPRRFIALVPIPMRGVKDRAASCRPIGLGPWVGARVAPLRCPILRPGRIWL